MRDLLLPASDTAVAVQALIVFGLLAAFGWTARRNQDLRVFVVGLTVLAIALFGVRAVH